MDGAPRRRSCLWARHPLFTRTTSQFRLNHCRKLAPARLSAPGALVVRSSGYRKAASWNGAAAAAALVVIALGSVSCGQTSPEGHPNDPPKPLVLTRGIGGQPGSLDPQRAEDAFSYDVLRDLYEGLTASTPDGAVIPATATSWRIEEGGRLYVFQLRRDARWSNGDSVTAAHFVAGFRRAMDPKTVSGAADLLRAIENAPAILQGSMPPDRLGVRAIDNYTLEIRLSRAVP